MGLKRKTIDLFITAIKSTPRLSEVTYKFSNLYIDNYRGFSYDPTQNGEQAIVLRALAAIFLDVLHLRESYSRHLNIPTTTLRAAPIT